MRNFLLNNKMINHKNFFLKILNPQFFHKIHPLKKITINKRMIFILNKVYIKPYLVLNFELILI